MFICFVVQIIYILGELLPLKYSFLNSNPPALFFKTYGCVNFFFMSIFKCNFMAVFISSDFSYSSLL